MSCGFSGIGPDLIQLELADLQGFQKFQVAGKNLRVVPEFFGSKPVRRFDFGGVWTQLSVGGELC